LVPIFEAGFDIASYQRLLERFYGFYAAFEPAAGFEPDTVQSLQLRQMIPNCQERRKLPMLKDDLRWLGLGSRAVAQLPVCSMLPELSSAAALFGALYVTEGSTLGGQVICRQLSPSLHLSPGRGASFFNGYGVETGSRWKAFTSALCQFAAVSRGADLETVMVDSAIATFKSIALWLSPDQVTKEAPVDASIMA
jgi:heme oxygenase